MSLVCTWDDSDVSPDAAVSFRPSGDSTPVGLFVGSAADRPLFVRAARAARQPLSIISCITRLPGPIAEDEAANPMPAGTLHEYRIAIDDAEDADIASHLEAANEALLAARQAKRTALVHCMMGMSRSVTVTAAFLVAVDGLTVANALRLLKQRRPIACPNAGFIEQLRRFAVAKVGPHADPPEDAPFWATNGEADTLAASSAVAWLPRPPAVDVATYLELLPSTGAGKGVDAYTAAIEPVPEVEVEWGASARPCEGAEEAEEVPEPPSPQRPATE